MRVIIAGGRDIRDYVAVCNAIADSGFVITEVVSGKAPGVDTLGERWAAEKSIPVKEFPAAWYANGRYDRSAGTSRNARMAAYAQALIAVWDGVSPGTRDMIARARRRGMKVHVHPYRKTNP